MTIGARKAHHYDNHIGSVYYARFEETAQHVLIGNLQLDDCTEKTNWSHPDRQKIMLQRKNLYLSMVQESIKHALKSDHKEILFQTGDAALTAQFEQGNSDLYSVPMVGAAYEDFLKKDITNALKALTRPSPEN